MVYGASKRPCLCSKTAVLKRICDRQRAQNADMAEKINKIMYETDRKRFHNEVVKDIQEDIAMVRAIAIDIDSNFDEINNKLKYITNKLEFTEENYIFPKVEIIQSRDIPHTPIQPNKKRNIGISFLFGALLSCSYVIGRYLFSNRMESENE